MPKFAAGFFAGVCTPCNATAHSCDPPSPRSTKEPKPHCQGSGPMWIMRRVTVSGALA